MNRLVLVVLVALAACGSSGPSAPSIHVAVPGYTTVGLQPAEVSAFRATYEREVGASDVTVARVSPPPSSPPARLTIIALRFDEHVPPGIVTRLAAHVPLADRKTVTVDGYRLVEQRRDDIYASTVVWVGARQVVVVYGGIIADEERVAVSVVLGLR